MSITARAAKTGGCTIRRSKFSSVTKLSSTSGSGDMGSDVQSVTVGFYEMALDTAYPVLGLLVGGPDLICLVLGPDLWPLIWSGLGPQERAAMRLTCKAACTATDALLDTAVLHALCNAPDASNVHAAAAACFHRRLPSLHTLTVHFASIAGSVTKPSSSLHAQQYLEAYTTAAVIQPPLPITHCSIITQPGSNATNVALFPLLDSLPSLEGLSFSGDEDFAPVDDTLQLLAWLALRPQLTALSLGWCLSSIELAALADVTHLQELSLTQILALQDVCKVAANMPHLTQLAIGGVHYTGREGKPPQALQSVTAISVPLPSHSYSKAVLADDRRMQLAQCLSQRDWEARTGWISSSALPFFPQLQKIEGMTIMTQLYYEADLRGLSDLPAAFAPISVSADRWAWSVTMWGKGQLRELQYLSPGSLACVRNLSLSVDVHGVFADVLSAILLAAPCVLHVRLQPKLLVGQLPGGLLAALQPLLRAAQLQTLHVCMPPGIKRIDSTQQVQALVDMVLLLVQPHAPVSATQRADHSPEDHQADSVHSSAGDSGACVAGSSMAVSFSAGAAAASCSMLRHVIVSGLAASTVIAACCKLTVMGCHVPLTGI